MIFKAPSFLQYIGSLIIAGLLAGLAYALMQSQGISSSVTILVTGLLIGHLIGVFAAPSTKTRSKIKKPSSKSAANSEIISLYVGNLAYSARRDALNDLFSQFGRVDSVRIMTDRETRRPRGYGFVEMEGSGALTAIKKLDGTEFCGRTLRVSEANQR
jgi:xanthosine utilization system XapX-like protein